MTVFPDPPKVHALLDRLSEAAPVWGVAQAKRDVDLELLTPLAEDIGRDD